ncbi:hypothetical protein CEXT_421411 [Caerostris extrusa]|uniref:Uncharacterized protein n=1 Tax=Caerostris extrusa TaxID=172846 RepID=A0AAV4S7A1_CAEEX|nr:hypothetical protein CEXT_421411 [Caerostris extrusa]
MSRRFSPTTNPIPFPYFQPSVAEEKVQLLCVATWKEIYTSHGSSTAPEPKPDLRSRVSGRKAWKRPSVAEEKGRLLCAVTWKEIFTHLHTEARQHQNRNQILRSRVSGRKAWKRVRGCHSK